MQTYILALDQGTTSSRALVFNRQGEIVATAQQEFTQYFPKPGWVEHDANEIWATQLACAQQALLQAGITAKQIASIGITNQRETTVVWNKKTGVPIAPAIVWQDRRTATQCDALKAQGLAGKIQETTGLVLDAYFSATKIASLLDNTPGARLAAERGELAFGTVDSWLIYKLTGGAVHATDISNASRTLLCDLQGRWNDEMLALFNVPRSVLPEILPSSGAFGVTAPALFGTSISINGCAGDQQAATFGQACTQVGMAKNTYGTGCFMLLNTGHKPLLSTQKLLTTIGWQIGNQAPSYALEGSVFMGGALVQWLRDGLGLIPNAAAVEALADSVPDNGGVTIVPAFTGLGAPYWDSGATGLITGLTRGATKAHIARAALEAIALQTADVLHAMQQDGGNLSELRVDGGASQNNLLMQLQADILGVEVVRPKITETTALGAAYLAGLSVGYWQSLEEINAQWAVDKRFAPQQSSDWRGAQLQRWQQAVKQARAYA